jgi:uncharacterized membrane protein
LQIIYILFLLVREVIDMIYAIFANSNDAGNAVSELKTNEYDVSVVARNNKGEIKETDTSDVPDVAEGAATGAVAGGLAGLLAGAVGLAIPGIGPLFVIGSLATSWGITGAALGALTGGLVAALTSSGVSEDIARGYEERVKSGDVLVAVESDSEDDDVKAILESHHAEEITTTEK